MNEKCTECGKEKCSCPINIWTRKPHQNDEDRFKQKSEQKSKKKSDWDDEWPPSSA
jgi:hypothetical protein